MTLLLLISLAGLVGLRHRQLRGLAILYWLLSWIGQSFALPLALTSVAVVMALVAYGPTRHVSEPIGLAAALIFLFLHVRNHRMGRALLDMVARTDVATQSRPALPAIPFLTGWWPLRVRRPGVERLRNIDYGEHGLRNRLDIFRPTVRSGRPLPVLIQIHGGGWVYGDKERQALPLMYHLASRGWMCVAINYRLAPKERFPAMLTDVLRAIAWVKHHAAAFGGDGSFVALTGGSAGGHLSALAALVPNRPELQVGFESEDTRVDAVMPLYGRYDFLDRAGAWGPVTADLLEFKSRHIMPGPPAEHPDAWALASPLSQVHADAPPFLVAHGTHDSLIAVEECRHFVEHLRRISTGEVLYAELHGAQHAFDFVMTPLSRSLAEAAEIFLSREYARSRRSRQDDADACRAKSLVGEHQ